MEIVPPNKGIHNAKGVKEEDRLVPGDVVFFQQMQKNLGAYKPWLKMKNGYAFGMMIGHLKPGMKVPTPQQLMQMLGSMGWITFDDIAEFLGEEQARIALQKHEEKYSFKPAEQATQPTAQQETQDASTEPEPTTPAN